MSEHREQFYLSEPDPEPEPEPEDLDILDNNLLSTLQGIQSQIGLNTKYQKSYEFDIQVQEENMERALFRKNAFCPNDIAEVLSKILEAVDQCRYTDLIKINIIDFLEDHITDIERIFLKPEIHKNGFYELLFSMISVYKSPGAKEIFLKHIDLPLKMLAQSDLVIVEQNIGYIRILTKEEVERHGLDNRIENILNNSSPKKYALIMNRLIESCPANNLQEFGQNLFRRKVTQYGFDPDVLLGVWKDNQQVLLDSNELPIRRICELEERIPGSARILYNKFGILNFHRYPLELLVEQYINRENMNAQYGVIIYPLVDNVGVFAKGEGEMFDHLYRDLQGTYMVRACECGTKFDVVRMLMNLDKKYGIKQKIQFMIIGGHGTKDSIYFGGSNSNHQLKTGDLKHQKARHLSSCFVENPSIILHSCETGLEDGIAQEISQLLHGEVIAPDSSTTFRSVGVSFGEDHKPLFEVSFREGLTKKYKNGTRIN